MLYTGLQSFNMLSNELKHCNVLTDKEIVINICIGIHKHILNSILLFFVFNVEYVVYYFYLILYYIIVNPL